MFNTCESSQLSWYRTRHRFMHYGEFDTIERLQEYQKQASAQKLATYILGNGSNTLFSAPTVQTVILKNTFPRTIEALGNNRFRISSSVPLMQILRYCLKHNLESFYYLSSVPAQLGGALAMNAGRGKAFNLSIFDFVESVTYVENGLLTTLEKKDIHTDYRKTIFTGIQNCFIISAVLHFPARAHTQENPILERIHWAKEHQDHSLPNCGSVFSECNRHIMHMLKGKSYTNAKWSDKTANWLVNTDKTGVSNSDAMLKLIKSARLYHSLLLQNCKTELILVS